jgi:hypothetical protein
MGVSAYAIFLVLVNESLSLFSLELGHDMILIRCRVHVLHGGFDFLFMYDVWQTFVE